jgi:hypothetical protein
MINIFEKKKKPKEPKSRKLQINRNFELKIKKKGVDCIGCFYLG